MSNIRKSSEIGNIAYDNRSWNYYELRGGELFSLLSGINDMHDHFENTLFSAIKRAVNGESQIYMFGCINNTQVVCYLVDDLDAVLKSYGIGESTHRHHISWKYSSIDDKKSPSAIIEIKFHCGCVLDRTNKRSIVNELKDQHGINLILSGISSFNTSDTVSVRAYRNSLRDKERELK